MKVFAVNGSARRDGNTAILVRTVFAELEQEGIETELIQLAGQALPGCRACYKCAERKDRRCILDKDIVNECIAKMIEADAIILASPTYVSDVTPEIKALIDRASLVAIKNDKLFHRKLGAGIVAVRRGGAIHALDSLNHFFLINSMLLCGSSYWNIGIGRNVGEVEQDAEGMQTMRNLGQNMAWAMHKLCP
jgi:multimeric flavodoxin WrbA